MPTGKVTPKTTRTKTTTKHLTKNLHSSTIVGLRESNQVVEAPLDTIRTIRTHTKGNFTCNTGKLKKYITILIYDLSNQPT